MDQFATNKGILVRTQQTISTEDLANIIDYACFKDPLKGKPFQKIVGGLGTILKNFRNNVKISAPALTAGLLLAPEESTKDALWTQFALFLTAFDSLMKGVEIRGLAPNSNSLNHALEGYSKKGYINKTLLGGYDFFIGGANTPATLVPQLITLYSLLSKIAPQIIDTIEQYIKQFGLVMNQDFVRSFEAGELAIGNFKKT